MPITNKKINTQIIISAFLSYANRSVDAKIIKQILNLNLHTISLFYISGILDYLGIENDLCEIDTECLRKIPLPVLSSIVLNDEPYFIIIKKVENLLITIHTIENDELSIPLEYFTKYWNGKILVVEMK
jgi:ABC-type bacteriocin/lantibiotic exporter with double-glycine peptidase domain